MPPFPVPVLGIGASVGISYIPAPEAIAEVLFAGQAPGLIAGAVQINVRVPPSAALTGDASLYVYAGNYFALRSIAIE
jgi:uncharacterized protein (TIGR03437 family)